MEERRIIHVEEKLPILETIPLSLQHLLPCFFGSTVFCAPLLLHVGSPVPHGPLFLEKRG